MSRFYDLEFRSLGFNLKLGRSNLSMRLCWDRFSQMGVGLIWLDQLDGDRLVRLIQTQLDLVRFYQMILKQVKLKEFRLNWICLKQIKLN